MVPQEILREVYIPPVLVDMALTLIRREAGPTEIIV